MFPKINQILFSVHNKPATGGLSQIKDDSNSSKITEPDKAMSSASESYFGDETLIDARLLKEINRIIPGSRSERAAGLLKLDPLLQELATSMEGNNSFEQLFLLSAINESNICNVIPLPPDFKTYVLHIDQTYVIRHQ
jgi:hypothetical protein